MASTAMQRGHRPAFNHLDSHGTAPTLLSTQSTVSTGSPTLNTPMTSPGFSDGPSPMIFGGKRFGAGGEQALSSVGETDEEEETVGGPGMGGGKPRAGVVSSQEFVRQQEEEIIRFSSPFEETTRTSSIYSLPNPNPAQISPSSTRERVASAWRPPAAVKGYSSLAIGKSSPSIQALHSNPVVMNRVNRIQADYSDSPPRQRPLAQHRRDPATESASPTLNYNSADVYSNNRSHSSRRIQPPQATPPKPRQVSASLQRASSAASAKRLIGVYEQLPTTPTGSKQWSRSGVRDRVDSEPTPGNARGARESLLELQGRKVSGGKHQSLPPPGTSSIFGLGMGIGSPSRMSQFPNTYLAKPLPTVSDISVTSSGQERPPLLSSYAPKMSTPERPYQVKAIPISSPTSFRSLAPHSRHDKSPLSKSPIESFMGALSGMGKKIKAGTRGRKGSFDGDEVGVRRGVFGRKKEVKSEPAEFVRPRTSTSLTGMGKAVLIQDVKTPPLRSGPALYLLPTPCSSNSPWGPWTPCTARLHPRTIEFHYFPASRDTTGHIGVLDLTDVTDTRSVQRSELHKMHVPKPETRVDGTTKEGYEEDVEVLEMMFKDGTTRYLGLHGKAGRLRWITAIWDAKTDTTRSSHDEPSAGMGGSLVPTTSVESTHSYQENIQRASPAPLPGSGRVKVRTAQWEGAGFGATAAAPGVPVFVGNSGRRVLPTLPSPLARPTMGETAPLQIRNMLPGDITPTTGNNTPAMRPRSPSPMILSRRPSLSVESLRESIKEMLEERPAGSPVASSGVLPVWDAEPHVESGRTHTEKPAAWVPAEKALSVFGRPSMRRGESTDTTATKRDRSVETYRGEASLIDDGGGRTGRSYEDSSDLNPSRSASQRAPRASTVLERAESYLEQTRGREGKPGTVIQFPIATPTYPVVAEAGSGTGGPMPGAYAKSAVSVATAVPMPNILQVVSQEVSSKATAPQRDLDQVTDLHPSSQIAINRLHNQGTPDTNTQAHLEGLNAKVGILGMQLSGLESQKTDNPSSAELQSMNSKLDTLIGTVMETLKAFKEEAAATRADALKEKEEKLGEMEVSEIMSPKLATPSVMSAAEATTGPPPAVTKESDETLQEVLSTLKDVLAGQTRQNQQTSDTAAYLHKLNGWLETFVSGSATEIGQMSVVLNRLVKEVAPEPVEGADGPAPKGLAGLLGEVHEMMGEVRSRAVGEAQMAQRVDSLIQMMTQERDVVNTIIQGLEQKLSSKLDQQRQENEALLRAVGTDLVNQIHGEHLNVERQFQTMQKDSDRVASEKWAEVAKAQQELHGIQMLISDLVAIKAKLSTVPEGKRRQTAPTSPHHAPQRTYAATSLGLPTIAAPPRGASPRPLPLPRGK